jgi:hypothetical protein
MIMVGVARESRVAMPMGFLRCLGVTVENRMEG